MPELLTICIPTYNRPEYLQQCLQSIRTQSFQDYRVVILDNASDADYTPILRQFVETDPRISYRRHPCNLGPEGNGLIALREYLDTKYLMIFHDDDLMHHRLLEYEVATLEQYPETVFVGSKHTWFAGNAPPFPPIASVPEVLFCDAVGLAKILLEGFDLHYGSVIYRSAALRGHLPDYQRFANVADRPYLLEIARQGRCALIAQPLVLYRIHPAQDSQIGVVAENNIIELFSAYRETLSSAWGPRMAWIFYKRTGFDLLWFHRRLRPINRSSVLLFLQKSSQNGVLCYPFLLFYFLPPLTSWLGQTGWVLYWRIYALLSAMIPRSIRRWLRRRLRNR